MTEQKWIALLSEIERDARNAAYGSDHIICHECADTADRLHKIIEQLQKSCGVVKAA